MPLQKMTRKEVKLMFKPWITSDIRKAMKERDSLKYKFNHTKDQAKKSELVRNYKELKNKILETTRKNKKTYFQEFFAKNVNDIKNSNLK